jgi:hypothetical protein
MNRKTSQSKRQQDSKRLLQNIEDLSRQLNQLILEEHQSEQQKDQQEDQQEDQQVEFEIGDLVENSNSYRGLRGTQGIVSHVTTHQVSLQAKGHQSV